MPRVKKQTNKQTKNQIAAAVQEDTDFNAGLKVTRMFTAEQRNLN